MPNSQKEKISKITTEIDNAVDDLFNAYQQVEIDPTTNEVRTVAAPAPKQKEPPGTGSATAGPTGLDFLPDELIEPAGLDVMTNDLLSQLDHSLLTLEWDVSLKNIESTRSLFKKLQGETDQAQPDLTRAFEIIGLLLDAMAESPQSVPTSGPKVLKDALAAIKKINAQPLPAEKITEIMAPVLDDLQATMLTEDDDEEALSGKTVTILEEAAGLTLAMQGDDSSEAAGSRTKTEETLDLKFDLVEEEKQAAVVKPPRVTVPAAPQASPKKAMTRTSAGQLPEGLLKVIQANISMLSICIDRVLPLENLFANKTGYDKLHVINKKLREQLELQRESLTRALAGDYQSFAAILSNPPPPKVSPKPEEPASSPCPWPNLTIARWKGSLVAFVPDQIGYVSTKTATAEKFANLTNLPLKRLKKWPWSSIRKLFRGELANKQESTLQRMELPILAHPGVLQALAEPRKEIYILLLYGNDTGGFAFLDSAIAEVTVSKQWRWEPVQKRDSMLVGHLQMQNEHLPVISLT